LSAGNAAAERSEAGTSLRILIIVNTDWYFWSHRLTLAKALRSAGGDVVIAAPEERGFRAAIEGEGFRFIPLSLGRRSLSPLGELRSLIQLIGVFRRERPAVVHNVTIKPVLYGSLAARMTGVSAVINAVPGLGYVFSREGAWGRFVSRVALWAYRICLVGSRTFVIFQNPDDRSLFVRHSIVSEARSVVIRGAGVDVERFRPSEEPAGVPIVLLASRLLWDKGVGDLVEAARRLKRGAIDCRVVLVGVPDKGNPSSIPEQTLREWQAEGTVEWWGLRDDMPAVLGGANIVVLPSYAEGVPKVLLEAAAAGRAIVTTDVPGCRAVVRDGENGILVPPRDPQALAEAIQRLLADAELRARMGKRGRELAVAEFSEGVVIRETLAVYESVLGERWTGVRGR